MKKLAEEINRNGFLYKQIKRSDKGAVYEQIFSGMENNKTIAYEVFKIRIGKPKVVFGVELPEKEKFPGDDDFGKWAWTYPDIEKAFSKFKQIENGEI